MKPYISVMITGRLENSITGYIISYRDFNDNNKVFDEIFEQCFKGESKNINHATLFCQKSLVDKLKSPYSDKYSPHLLRPDGLYNRLAGFGLHQEPYSVMLKFWEE